MKINFLTPFLFFICFGFANAQHANIYIDSSQKGADVPKSLYGIFFEEISHSGDGGLYAELIQNRGFEEHVLPSGTTYRDGRAWAPSKPDYFSGQIKNFSVSWDIERLKYTAWSLVQSKAEASMTVVNEYVLHENTPHSMKVEISNVQTGGYAALQNSGYWGVPLRNGEVYKLRFYLRSSDYDGTVQARVIEGSTVMLQKEFNVDKTGEWKEYTAEITATGTTNTGVFQLNFSAPGTVWVDYVSLFPKDTYKGRENGLRKDVAQMLADLKPAFMRWPGGCIVEGITIENRVKWKETLGDPMTRRGEWNRWGYRSTYGFGYHEFLQLCEDMGADAMYVGNVGISCMFNNGDYVEKSELPAFIQDIRDAIDYAIGDENTEWGARRIANGHPEPFPLKYVELGNEQWGPFYPPIHDIFYGVLKQEYPQITFISTLQVDLDAYSMNEADMIDPHYYQTAEWFYDNTHYWDMVKRKDYKVYVGEYACNQNVGAGHMGAALSEAAYMIGMERNSDMVTMSSYAPLIENNNLRSWPTNMIWVKNEGVVGRSSYYVQQLFANHLPDYNLQSTLVLNEMQPATQGRVGLGTWETQAVYKNFSIKKHDGSEYFYQGDFVNQQSDWEVFQGNWNFSDSTYIQQSMGTRCISMMNEWMYNDCAIEVQAKKTGGNEGFLLVLGVPVDNLDLHYQVNLGGWGNSRSAIEIVKNGVGSVISEPVPFKIANDQWYDIKVVVKNGNQITCYVDGEYIMGAAMNPTGEIQAIAGYDEEQGEAVIKIVNGTTTAKRFNIKLNNKNIEPNGKVIFLASPVLEIENSFSNPTLISPKELKFTNFSSNFNYWIRPTSVTVFRIKCDKEADGDMVVPAWYSDSPIPVNPSGISELDHSSTINIINVGPNVWEVQANNQQIKNISVYDIKGALMMDQHVGKNRLPLINLSQAEKGCYIVQILGNDGQHVKEKLMVM